MKFDVIIGNPPYQMETGGPGHHARPIYNLFVEQAKKLNPRYLIMIIPSRWFAGGMGLDQFRKDMLSDRRIKKIVDFPNAKDCFPENSISGGVCYFLWDREYDGDCEVVNIRKNTDNGKDISRTIRSLSEFDSIFVRYNDAVSIIRKVLAINGESISSMVSPTDPFGIETYVRGESNTSSSSITLHSSKGHGFISKSKISKGKEYLDKYKVLISCIGSEHAVEPGNDGKFSIISGSMEVIGPKEVCTGSYIIIPAESHEIAENIAKYLRTKFVRFLVLQALTSIHLTKSTFKFVPVQDFNESWTDSKLYNKYKLTNEEINFIENMIRPFNERKK